MTKTSRRNARQPAAQIAPTLRVTKKTQLIRMLSGKNGADATAISKKLGWLPHTTRAAITSLRKSGYQVETDSPGPGKPTRYRIKASPDSRSEAMASVAPANAG